MSEFSVKKIINPNTDIRYIIFHGLDEKLSNENFKDGSMDVVCNNSVVTDYYNSTIFLDYLKKNYSDDDFLKNILMDDYSFNVLLVKMYLTHEINDLIFEDVTLHNEDNKCQYDKHVGLFILPSHISNLQKEKLLEYENFFSLYKQITFCTLDVDINHNLINRPIDFIEGSQFTDFINNLPDNSYQYIK